MSEDAEDNQEDDEAGYPANHLVPVNDLVAEKRDEEGTDGDDENASIARDVFVNGMDELST